MDKKMTVHFSETSNREDTCCYKYTASLTLLSCSETYQNLSRSGVVCPLSRTTLNADVEILTLHSDGWFDCAFPLSPATLCSFSDWYWLTALYFNIPIWHASGWGWSTVSVSEGCWVTTATTAVLSTWKNTGYRASMANNIWHTGPKSWTSRGKLPNVIYK